MLEEGDIESVYKGSNRGDGEGTYYCTGDGLGVFTMRGSMTLEMDLSCSLFWSLALCFFNFNDYDTF